MIFEHKDILILGDSFAQSRSLPVDWPFIVSQSLTSSTEKTRGYGFGGASWWSVRKRLLQELKFSVPKVLILCHTEPNRIPSDYDYGLNSASCVEAQTQTGRIRVTDHPLESWKEKKIATAGTLYYEELWSGQYCKWAMVSWFKELDELVEVHKIPYVIHLRCFDHGIKHIFKNGMTVKENLVDMSLVGNQYRNHFTEEMNKKVGNRLVELLLNYQPGLQELALKNEI